MEYWSLKSPQWEKTEGPAVAPLNCDNFIISNTATKTKQQDT